jgi:sec-independent protein translocase protein TatA
MTEAAWAPVVLGFITGHWEILVIGGVVVLLFFGRKIPEIMRSLGKGVTQFKKGLKEGREEDEVKSLPAPKNDGPGVGKAVEKEEAGVDRPLGRRGENGPSG